MKDNNILIANFIGMQKTNIGWYDAEEILLKVEQDNTFDILKFNTDWNWLMLVASKIFETDLYYSKYIDYNSSMFSEGKIELSTNITKVYEQCVDFIEWWNKEMKSKNN